MAEALEPMLAERTLVASEALLERERGVLADVLKIRFFPFAVASGSGSRLFDADGNEYLDLTASAGVAQTGYGHAKVRAAIADELDRLPTAMLCCYPHEPAVELAERLCGLVPGDFAKKAWFGTTGSDANDCCARLLPMATGRRRLISYVGGYHGTTTGSATLSGHQAQASVIGGGNVTKVPYPDPYRCAFGPCSGTAARCAASSTSSATRSARSRRPRTPRPSSSRRSSRTAARSCRRPTTSRRCASSATATASGSSSTR